MRNLLFMVAVVGILLIDGSNKNVISETPSYQLLPPAYHVIAAKPDQAKPDQAAPDQAKPDQASTTEVSARGVAVRVATAPVRAFRHRTILRGHLFHGRLLKVKIRCGRFGCG
jgi:hypothetical protein